VKDARRASRLLFPIPLFSSPFHSFILTTSSADHPPFLMLLMSIYYCIFHIHSFSPKIHFHPLVFFLYQRKSQLLTGPKA
jgi:hypothetical protein